MKDLSVKGCFLQVILHGIKILQYCAIDNIIMPELKLTRFCPLMIILFITLYIYIGSTKVFND